MKNYALTINGELIDDEDDEIFNFASLIPAEVESKAAALQKPAEVSVPRRVIAENERAHAIKVYVTEKEYELIKENAGTTAVSTWVRNVALKGTGQKYPIEVRTDDIDDLRRLLSDYNLHANGFIGGLRYRGTLNQSDIDHMTGLMAELNTQVAEALRVILCDRKYEKKKTEREMRSRLDRIEELYKERVDAEIARYGTGRKGRRSLPL